MAFSLHTLPTRRLFALALMFLAALTGAIAQAAQRGRPVPPNAPAKHGREFAEPLAGWRRHTIDRSSQGADGVRLGDLNKDGRLDIVTGWEEGGVVRAYLHPGFENVRQLWPGVTVGEVISPEDAVFADLDGDGNLDVLSSTEGKDRSIYVHWGPAQDRVLDPSAWLTVSLAAAKERMRWMFALPMDIDGTHGIDFFAGGKDTGAAVGWFEAPPSARDGNAWRWHPLREVGWLMSLISADMDGDGDADLLFSDRKGPRTGVFWLENPGKAHAARSWKEHPIGHVSQDEVMFLAYADLDGDGLNDVISAVKPQQLDFYRRLSPQGRFAAPVHIPFPDTTGSAKGVAVGDVDGDGLPDLLISCEHAVGAKRGVVALLATRTGKQTSYRSWDISGAPGTKFDLLQLLDLDGDGDLDVVTCEETENLGVFWYENPTQ